MSIRQIAPDKWIIDYYPEGAKGKRKRIVFPGSEKQALQYEMELRRHHPSSIRTNPKIINVIPEYLEWLKLHRSKETYRDIFNSLKWLIPHFGNLQMPYITESIINEYKKKRLAREGKKELSPRTINKELQYFKSILNFMVKRNYANPLPFKIEALPYTRPVPQIPHPSEIAKLINQIKDPLKKALILLWWQAGLRYNDAAQLKWEDIDWQTSTIKITQKGGKQRLCAMPKEVKEILWYIRDLKGYVFENPKTGRPYGSLKTMLKTACKNAGIKHINPHLLRHAFGTYSLEATGDLRLVQVLLGHKDIQSTQLYTQIASTRLSEAIQRTADYIGHLKSPQKPMDKRSIKPRK